jgi:hypothetical protein
MSHIVLLGDSIFDNRSYTNGGPDVISQVQELLPTDSRATLLAVDGSTTNEIPAQMKLIPSDATHLVLSAGGNDAIMNSDVLLKSLKSTVNALSELADISEGFERNYRAAVASCRGPQLPLTICTIYNGNFPDPQYQRMAATALTLFNDVILRVAFEFRLSVIDLRFVCASPEDYANPIEPSSIGGAKIARCILDSLQQDSRSAARVYIT